MSCNMPQARIIFDFILENTYSYRLETSIKKMPWIRCSDCSFHLDNVEISDTLSFKLTREYFIISNKQGEEIAVLCNPSVKELYMYLSFGLDKIDGGEILDTFLKKHSLGTHRKYRVGDEDIEGSWKY